MSKQKVVIILLILLLVVTNILWFWEARRGQKQIQAARESALVAQNRNLLNEKIVQFLKLFVGKVLQSDQEVDFETRLLLENAVRDLKDEGVLMQWQKFTQSQTEPEAQKEVKNLIELLVNKIKVKE